jgi:uncharacterized membrane protein (Fun14 family)
MKKMTIERFSSLFDRGNILQKTNGFIYERFARVMRIEIESLTLTRVYIKKINVILTDERRLVTVFRRSTAMNISFSALLVCVRTVLAS